MPFESSGRFKGNFEAESLEPLDQVLLGTLGVASIEVVRPQVTIADAIADNPECNLELLMGSGDAGLLGATFGTDPPIEGAQVGVIGMGGGQRGLRESASNPTIPLPGSCVPSFARTLAIAGT